VVVQLPLRVVLEREQIVGLPREYQPDGLKGIVQRIQGDHHQPEFRRMGQRVRRRDDDFGAARPPCR